MPVYTFRNKDTDELIELEMKISEYDDFLKNHPELRREYASISTIERRKLMGGLKVANYYQQHLDRINRFHRRPTKNITEV